MRKAKLAMHPDMDRKLRVALAGHELAHGLTVDEVCGGKRKSKPKRRAARPRSRVLAAMSSAARFLLGGGRRKTKKKCVYYGQHDKAFYDRAVRVQRALGTDPKAAVLLEKLSGYSPPPGYGKAIASRRRRKK